MVLRSCFSAPARSHMPMHGPQAFANTVAPMLLNTCMNPSRLTVYRTCSEPGVIVNLDLAFIFFSFACFASDTARSHMPMHGPQAFANTVAPMLLNTCMNPSRLTVYRTCSEPGVIVNLDLAFSFFS